MADIATLAIKVDASQAKEASKSLDGLSDSSQKTEKSIASMSAKIVGASAAIAGTFAVIKASVKAATEYQNSLNGLASVARYAGEDVSASLAMASQITTDGLLSTTEAATALKNLLARGFSTDQAVEMINRFKDAAAFGRQSSLDFGDAVVSATEGIKNENSMLVDNAGITKNVAKMWEEYAASIGKATNDLTQAEKRTAEYNGVLKETEGQLGNASLAAEGMEGSTARMDKAFNDAAVTIGQTFMPAAVAVTNAITQGFQGAMEYGVQPMLFGFEALGIKAAEAASKIGLVSEFLTSPSKWNTSGVDSVKNQLLELSAIAEDMMTSAAGRISGVSGPKALMGKDSGARRTDTAKAAKAGKTKKGATGFTDYQDRINQAVSSAIEGSDVVKAGEYAKQIEKLDSLFFDAGLSAEIYSSALDKITGSSDKASDSAKKYEDSLKSMLDATPSAQLEKDREDMILLADAYTAGKISVEQYTEAAQTRLGTLPDTTKSAMDEMTVFAKKAGENIQDAFAEFLFDPFKGGMDDMLSNFSDMLRRMAAEALASQAMSALGDWGKSLSGSDGFTGFIGSLASGMFGGAKADGGSVGAGSTYLVGEKGPELFTAPSDGNIVPNNAMRSTTIVNNFTLSQPADRRTQEQIAAMAGASIQNAMARGA